MHGADGTPVSTRERYARGQGALRVERHGRQRAEFLIQRVILQDTRGSTHVVMTEPEPMESKHAWCHLSAAREVLELPR